jgi:hypothetical protein
MQGPSGRNPFHIAHAKAILASLVCSLAVFALVLFLRSGPVARSLTAVTPTPVPPCSAPDPTFCATQAQFVQIMKDNNFAGMLELQAPVTVDCNNPDVSPIACSGINTSKLNVETYAINESGILQYLPRNSYIAYFNDLSAKYGPFAFGSDTGSGANITMIFPSSSSSKILRLPFLNSQNTWKLQTPVVN